MTVPVSLHPYIYCHEISTSNLYEDIFITNHFITKSIAIHITYHWMHRTLYIRQAVMHKRILYTERNFRDKAYNLHSM